MITVRTNLTNNASTQYRNHDFNSFAEVNGKILAANENGIFEINSGDTDHGTQIDGYFIPGDRDFESNTRKRIRSLYISGCFYGNISVLLEGDRNGIAIGPYTMFRETEGLQTRRIDIGRGFEFSTCKFKFSNVGGGAFTINSVVVDVDSRNKSRR